MWMILLLIQKNKKVVFCPGQEKLPRWWEPHPPGPAQYVKRVNTHHPNVQRNVRIVVRPDTLRIDAGPSHKMPTWDPPLKPLILLPLEKPLRSLVTRKHKHPQNLFRQLLITRSKRATLILLQNQTSDWLMWIVIRWGDLLNSSQSNSKWETYPPDLVIPLVIWAQY